MTENATRIAELEREIAELEAANEATPTWGAAVGARCESIKGLLAELARLRNEQPKWGDTAPELIPSGVYYNDGNFYSVAERKGMGWDFFNKWQSRRSEFPPSPALTQGEGSEPVGWQYEALAKAVQQMESEKISAESNGSSNGAYIRGFYDLYPVLVRHPNEDRIAHARRIKTLIYASPPPLPEEDDGDGTTRKDVESWMAYFDAHAEEFVAAHEAIIRKATSLPAGNADVDATGEDRCVSTGPFDGTTPANADGLILNQTGNESRNDALNVPRLPSGRDYATMLARLVRRIEKGLPLEGTLNQARGLIARGSDEFFSPLRESPAGNADPRVREALESIYRYANRSEAPRWECVPESLKTKWLSALPSPQSQGLVDAAEWQPIETAPKDTEILARIAVHGDHGELYYHRHSVLIRPTKRSYWFDTAALRQLSREEKIVGWRPLSAARKAGGE